jgi:hypothetical protein
MIEYIPVVFKLSANWDFVFLPDVPLGTYPTVRQRIPKPKNPPSNLQSYPQEYVQAL